MSVDKLLKEGDSLLAEGESRKAFNKFKAAAKESPQCAAAYFGQAEAAVAMNDLSIAEVAQLYRQAISLDTENAYYCATYASFCLENGLLPQAEEYYLKAASLDPENARMFHSDLAVGYYTAAMDFMEQYPDLNEKKIKLKALTYAMKALDIDKEEAIELLKGA